MSDPNTEVRKRSFWHYVKGFAFAVGAFWAGFALLYKPPADLYFKAFVGAIHPEVVAGALLALLPFVLFYFACQNFSKEIPFWLALRRRRVKKSLTIAKRKLSKHTKELIHHARPRVKSQRRWWEECSSRFIEAYAEEVCKLEHPPFEAPLYPANFQIYARCVSSLLQAITAKGRPQPAYTCYTLLRRPLIDWYNLFPVRATLHDGSGSIAAISLDWWEDYKTTVSDLRDNRAVIMKRLVAHPEASYDGTAFDEEAIKGYCVYVDGNRGRPLEDPSLNALAEAVTLVPQVADAIASGPLRGRYKKHGRLHVIAETCPGPGATGTWQNMISHFESQYHIGSGESQEAVAGSHGVFYKYAASIESALLLYDDVFLLECDGAVFGIGLLRNEELDECAIRLLNEQQLSSVKNAFEGAWRQASDEFCLCKGTMP